MRKYALLKNNTVVAIKEMETIEFLENSREYQLIVDITDESVQPKIDWILQGNRIVNYTENMSFEQIEDLKMRARFKVGNKICDEAVIMISARNRLLGKSSAEVNQIIGTFSPIEQAMRKCALPTALGGINLMKAGFAEYSDIFDYVSSELSNYLNTEV